MKLRISCGDPNVAATLNAFTDMAAETDPKKKLKKLKATCLLIVLTLCFIIFPSTSLAVFKLFACDSDFDADTKTCYENGYCSGKDNNGDEQSGTLGCNDNDMLLCNDGFMRHDYATQCQQGGEYTEHYILYMVRARATNLGARAEQNVSPVSPPTHATSRARARDGATLGS